MTIANRRDHDSIKPTQSDGAIRSDHSYRSFTAARAPHSSAYRVHEHGVARLAKMLWARLYDSFLRQTRLSNILGQGPAIWALGRLLGRLPGTAKGRPD